MVVVVDYRAGNLYNVGHALKYLGVEFVSSDSATVINSASQVILPGVGSAQAAMDSLSKKGLVKVLRKLRVPFLGICLGLQLLFETSEEEQTSCLGVFPGTVRKFDKNQVKVPHVGWNQISLVSPRRKAHDILFRNILEGEYFYFIHSYFAPLQSGVTLTSTQNGSVFASAVAKDNYWGVQFHPERSGGVGLRLLENFLKLSGSC